MPHYFIELYTPKPSWLEMPAERRTAFLDVVNSAMNIFSNLGVNILYLGKCDPSVSFASSHLFMGIWSFEDPQVRHELLSGIETAGWYDYFDHINAISHADGNGKINGHIADLVSLMEGGY